MTGYLRPRCIWCGHQFTAYEWINDHRLWCSGRPSDAITSEHVGAKGDV